MAKQGSLGKGVSRVGISLNTVQLLNNNNIWHKRATHFLCCNHPHYSLKVKSNSKSSFNLSVTSMPNSPISVVITITPLFKGPANSVQPIYYKLIHTYKVELARSLQHKNKPQNLVNNMLCKQSHTYTHTLFVVRVLQCVCVHGRKRTLHSNTLTTTIPSLSLSLSVCLSLQKHSPVSEQKVFLSGAHSNTLYSSFNLQPISVNCKSMLRVVTASLHNGSVESERHLGGRNRPA